MLCVWIRVCSCLARLSTGDLFPVTWFPILIIHPVCSSNTEKGVHLPDSYSVTIVIAIDWQSTWRYLRVMTFYSHWKATQFEIKGVSSKLTQKHGHFGGVGGGKYERTLSEKPRYRSIQSSSISRLRSNFWDTVTHSCCGIFFRITAANCSWHSVHVILQGCSHVLPLGGACVLYSLCLWFCIGAIEQITRHFISYYKSNWGINSTYKSQGFLLPIR